MSKKEGELIGNQEARLVLGNVGNVDLGAWMPVPPELHDSLKPYVQDVGGVPSVPARLFHRVNSALNKPTTQK